MSADAEVRLPNVAGLEPFSVRVEPMAVAGLAFARDGEVPGLPADGEDVPWSFFTLLRAQFRLGASIHRLMDRDPVRGLMVSMNYEGTDGCARVGELVDARCELARQRVLERERGALALTAVRTTWTARDRDWTLVETTTMADLFGHHDPPERRAPTGSGPEIALGAMSRLRLAWCCVATEDLQAVHHDPRLARERGYDDVLVPGTLLAAIAERHLRERHPSGLVELGAHFVAPTYPDDDLVWRWKDSSSFEIYRASDLPSVVAIGEGRPS